MYIHIIYPRAQSACPPPCLKTSSSSDGQHLCGVCPGPMCCIVELSRVADCRPSLPVVVSEETTSSHEDTCWILAACYNLMGCLMECFSGHYASLSLCLSPLGLAVVWRVWLFCLWAFALCLSWGIAIANFCKEVLNVFLRVSAKTPPKTSREGRRHR